MTLKAVSSAARRESEPISLEQAERTFLEAEIDHALAPYRSSLPTQEIEWMRAQLLAEAEGDRNVSELARAAFPREVDQSGEIVRKRRS
jgi:ActR/RegA family two-component response regulator